MVMVMGNYRLKRTFDIRLEGRADRLILDADFPGEVALKPADFKGVNPKLLVAEGDKVCVGTPLFCHKDNRDIVFTSTASGTVKEIRRGDRRIIESVIIRTDGKQKCINYKIPKGSIENFSAEDVKKVLLESGLFACFIQRPFGIIADPSVTPRDIFITAMDTSPLAPLMSLCADCENPYFQAGISILNRLTSGKVHVSVEGKFSDVPPEILTAKGFELHKFIGNHPAGNVGVQIEHIAPIKGRDDVVWTINLNGVNFIGKLFLEGKIDPEVIVAVTGLAAKKRCYYRTIIGASLLSFIGEIDKGNVRIISGNVLTGRNEGLNGYLGFFHYMVTAIPEPEGDQILGWATLGLNKRSFSRTYLSSFFNYAGRFREESAMNGSLRPFIATGIYEDVLPMDIYPVFLIKSIIAGEIEEMENLGIYEVIEEDLALVEYVDPSKQNFQEILRKGIDQVRREG
jgi:Na+-transporting NADH:ubiquinone oxidoreductase subunit A